MFWFRSIGQRWGNRGLAWKTGFLAGVVMSGVAMMALHGGVPLSWNAREGGSHLMIPSSFRVRTNDPSIDSSHGQIGIANHLLAGSSVSASMKSNITGADFARIDGSNCQNSQQQKMTLHPLPLREGRYLIYLPAPAKDKKGVPVKPAFAIEYVRDSVGCST